MVFFEPKNTHTLGRAGKYTIPWNRKTHPAIRYPKLPTWVAGCYSHVNVGTSPSSGKKKTHTILPRKLTWNLKITCLKRKIIFQPSILGFHVSFRGSTTTSTQHESWVRNMIMIHISSGMGIILELWDYRITSIKGEMCIFPNHL